MNGVNMLDILNTMDEFGDEINVLDFESLKKSNSMTIDNIVVDVMESPITDIKSKCIISLLLRKIKSLEDSSNIRLDTCESVYGRVMENKNTITKNMQINIMKRMQLDIHQMYIHETELKEYIDTIVDSDDLNVM
jgi:hypothetical protein